MIYQSSYLTEHFSCTHSYFFCPTSTPPKRWLSQPSRPISFSASEDELTRVLCLYTVLYVSDLSSALNWAEQTPAQTTENIFLIDSCCLAVQSSLRIPADFHSSPPRSVKSATLQELSTLSDSAFCVRSWPQLDCSPRWRFVWHKLNTILEVSENHYGSKYLSKIHFRDLDAKIVINVS